MIKAFKDNLKLLIWIFWIMLALDVAIILFVPSWGKLFEVVGDFGYIIFIYAIKDMIKEYDILESSFLKHLDNENRS